VGAQFWAPKLPATTKVPKTKKGRLMAIKFVYITDTHYGAENVQFFEQPSYPERLPELLSLLDARIKQDKEIQFVIHGGDMVNHCSEAVLQKLPEVFHLSVPLYLCLGNHDLTHPDALNHWLQLAPDFFPARTPCSSIALEQGYLHIVPNHWSSTPYYWEDVQDAHFSADQLADVEKTVQQNPNAAHIFFTHSNIMGILPGQTGFPQPYNSPKEAFSQQVFTLTEKYPQVRTVISGHTHVNSHVRRNEIRYITASSFVEAPFEYKIFEVNNGNVSMTTENLFQAISFPAEYNFNKVFVQGILRDREFRDGA
jgi:predicted phosphodiesterase